MQEEKQRLGFETPLSLQTLAQGSEILHKSSLTEKRETNTNKINYGCVMNLSTSWCFHPAFLGDISKLDGSIASVENNFVHTDHSEEE